jgi:multimeric flavodoxin WrbA
MKVVAITGNTRPNSSALKLAQTVLESAAAKGAQTQLLELRNLKYNDCIACMGCRTTSDRCVVQDDLQQVLEAVRNADAVVFSSPVYFGEVSGQFKCCFDRFFSFFDTGFKNRLAPGKKSIFIIVQGAEDEKSFDDIVPRYEQWLKFMKFDMSSMRAIGIGDVEDLDNKPEYIEEAKKLGQAIFEK